MKVIHTADLHLGQVIYQNYDRADEHAHFFRQLREWCEEEQPDALLVSGDVFDIQQPSAVTKKAFTDSFVKLHVACPKMKIVITAGNHDSASRIQADGAVWEYVNAVLVGPAPSMNASDPNWQDDYIVRLDSGYIVALPYMTGNRTAQLQSILDKVAEENRDGKPVVMMGHLAVTGMDSTGHDYEIGTIRTQDVKTLGTGYDYCALGHIHKPQTIGHLADYGNRVATYPAGVVRYSGSALHVSCDEKFPHTVSVVNIERHGGDVTIRQLRIDELRHFYELPEDKGSYFKSADEAIKAIRKFAEECKRGYIRLRIDYNADLPANFSSMVYDTLRPYHDEMRFNPKHIWIGKPETTKEDNKPTFAVAELQEMTNPYTFVEKTIAQYPGLDLNMVKEAFEEVKEEVRRLAEAESKAAEEKKEKKASKGKKTTETSTKNS
ncbi:MAG: exonuclease SbcCD subunit D [Bacteroidaceae bacterium]|nr:exonuclease SbcCD subunit D [Bacteroidaceae bacterium]